MWSKFWKSLQSPAKHSVHGMVPTLSEIHLLWKGSLFLLGTHKPESLLTLGATERAGFVHVRVRFSPIYSRGGVRYTDMPGDNSFLWLAKLN